MIKECTLEDLNRLYEIENQAFDQSSYPLDKQALKKHLQEGKKIYGFWSEDKLTGYVFIIEYKKSLRIYSLAVMEEFRGQGIAHKLVEFVLGMAKKDEKSISLEVAESNKRAIRLYQSFGFKSVKLLPAYYKDGRNGVKMKLD